MLKSFSHIVLSFLLLAATTGMAVSKHYCGDFLISTALFSEAEFCCDSENCCRNENEFYQLNEDFAAPSISQMPEIIGNDLFFSFIEAGFDISQKESTKFFFTERKPPLPHNIQTALSLKQSWLLWFFFLVNDFCVIFIDYTNVLSCIERKNWIIKK